MGEKHIPPGKIFVNYRRSDDPGFAGRIYDRLGIHFTQDQIFMDIDNIPPGVDFVRELGSQISEASAFLTIIGQDWLTLTDDQGIRRIDDPNDFVRIEIELALRFNLRVIPVLVNRAEMPNHEDLPVSIAMLARRNAVRINHTRFGSDVAGLIRFLESALLEEQQSRLETEREEQWRKDVTIANNKREAPQKSARNSSLIKTPTIIVWYRILATLVALVCGFLGLLCLSVPILEFLGTESERLSLNSGEIDLYTNFSWAFFGSGLILIIGIFGGRSPMIWKLRLTSILLPPLITLIFFLTELMPGSSSGIFLNNSTSLGVVFFILTTSGTLLRFWLNTPCKKHHQIKTVIEKRFELIPDTEPE